MESWKRTPKANSQSALSLANPKPRRFGEELRRHIRDSFGTSRAFAEALGVSEGRVSQIIKGSESIAASTLDEILATFEGVGIQQSLHSAWVETYAPSPLALVANLDSEAHSIQLLGSFSALIAAGSARQLLTSLQSTLPGVRDPTQRLRVLRGIADLALYLERPSLAREAATRMLELARNPPSHVWLALSLSLRATATRINTAKPPREVLRDHEAFAGFVSSWPPTSNDREFFRSLRFSAIRDRALTLISLHRSNDVRSEQLEAGIDPLRRLIRELDDPIDRAIGLEVVGRMLVTQGALFAAEDVLDEVQAIRGHVSYDHDPKTRLLRAQILIARGELDEAGSVLAETILTCGETDARHHAASAERLLENLPTGVRFLTSHMSTG